MNTPILQPKTSYPAALHELEDALTTMLETNGHNAGILYYTRLKRATDANKKADVATIMRLVEHWYEYFDKLESNLLSNTPQKTVRGNHPQKTVRENTVSVLEMLAESGHVRAVADTDTGVGLLGYLLLQGSYSISIGITVYRQELLVNIIDQLSNTQNGYEVVQDVQTCISRVYGPLVWDLYREDAMWDADLPYHFMKLGLTPTCLTPSYGADTPANNPLPTNLA